MQFWKHPTPFFVKFLTLVIKRNEIWPPILLIFQISEDDTGFRFLSSFFELFVNDFNIFLSGKMNIYSLGMLIQLIYYIVKMNNLRFGVYLHVSRSSVRLHI